METFSTITLPGSSLWAWSKGQHTQPLLATAAADASVVSIHTSQGAAWAHAKGGVKNIRGTPAACLAWHPDRQLLAVAWQDGAVSLWDATSRHLEEDSKCHRHPVSLLLWHPGGQHFVTADVQGKVTIWEVNMQQQPVCVCSHANEAGIITHAVWLAAGNSTPQVEAQHAVCYAVSTPGSASVTLKCLNHKGSVSVVQDIGEDLVSLLHYEERSQLVAVTSSGSAVVLSRGDNTDTAVGGSAVSPDVWNVLLRMKVSSTAAGSGLQVCWAGPHTLALAGNQDSAVRMLQLDTDDNYVLDLRSKELVCSGSMHPQEAAAAPDKGGIVALVYEPVQQVLAAATAAGKVCLFKHWLSKAHAAAAAATAAAADPASQWQPTHCFWVGVAPEQLGWGPTAQVLAASCGDGLYICQKSPLHNKISGNYAAIQVAAGKVLVHRLDGTGQAAVVSTTLQVAGLDISEGALLLHDGWQAEVHRINNTDGSVTLEAQFKVQGLATAANAGGHDVAAHDGSGNASHGIVVGTGDGQVSMALHGQCVYRTAEGRVEVCSWAGAVRQPLLFDESQGQPRLLDGNNGYLAVLTSKAVVRVFKLLGSEAKPYAGPGPILPAKACSSLQLDAIRVNCDGSMVCALASLPSSGGCHDPRLFVYSAERNGPLVLDFSQDLTAPRSVCWDLADPRLLAVQTGALVRTQNGSSRPNSGDSCSTTASPQGLPAATAQCLHASGEQVLARCGDVATVFATGEAGLLLQEYQDLDVTSSGFLGIAAPHLLLVKGAASSSATSTPDFIPSFYKGSYDSSSPIQSVPLRCFSGLADVDAETRRALLDFNYLLAVGRLDEAFRAVSALKSPAVWRSMAHMAIRNKQLAVAEHCLGNMQHVRGARALREGATIAELDARVGLVAVQLGLISDAARLFSSCERWDLLEQLHAASGSWQDALQVANKQDRARLQAVHHAYAQHCEAVGDSKTALQHYIAAGTAATEVPRMLWKAGDMAELERQVLCSDDVDLLTWWARTCEAGSNFQQAISCYLKAGNQLAVLRIHCATGNWAAAEQLVESTQDPAAAFHLARLYEAQDRATDALRCYSISKRFGHGARLAKRCDMQQELLSFALKSSPAIMLEAADHLLAAGNMQAAALLYQKGGKLGKAVEMAFAAGMLDVLDSITAQMDQDADGELVARCVDALLASGRHEPAVHLLLKAQQPERALDVLLEHDVPLSEELAEALTPAKTADNADSRNAVLLRIAQAAKAQGMFHLACKKYTQAGDRLRAMRALVKSGDVDKIVFFAGVSRQREVYIMAANYLQTLNWRAQPEYLNHILTFYTKAGAADSLAQFYLNCAHTELSQFKAYDKALQAMQEAAKHLAKSRATDREAQLAALQDAADRISRFSQAQSILAHDPATAVALCQQLLQEAPEHTDAAPDVAVGDVYALLVEWVVGQGNMPQALQLVEQMLDRRVPPGHYLSGEVLAAIQQAMGVSDLDTQHVGRHGQQEAEPGVEDLPCIRDEADAADIS